jgi:hypothetical protein
MMETIEFIFKGMKITTYLKSEYKYKLYSEFINLLDNV